jgi:mycothiol system anti-sigma-R factor
VNTVRCERVLASLDAFIDGEFDQTRAAAIQAHAAGCERCTRLIADRRALRSVIQKHAEQRSAPDSLRAAISQALDPAAIPARIRTPVWPRLSLAAAIILLGITTWLAVSPRSADLNSARIQEAVSSHIRALMATHLLDIATSDQHTVKPWFDGRIDFAPPVVDYAAFGFPLAGGRLDYIARRPAAAIVYARGAHTINLFISPSTQGPTPVRAIDDRGYHTRTWSDEAMWYCAVSDVNEADLAAFVKLVQSGRNAAETPEPGR